MLTLHIHSFHAVQDVSKDSVQKPELTQRVAGQLALLRHNSSFFQEKDRRCNLLNENGVLKAYFNLFPYYSEKEGSFDFTLGPYVYDIDTYLSQKYPAARGLIAYHLCTATYSLHVVFPPHLYALCSEIESLCVLLRKQKTSHDIMASISKTIIKDMRDADTACA